MKKDGSEKSLQILLCWLCVALFLFPAAPRSSSANQRIVTEDPITRMSSPDLSEMFRQVNESRLRSYVESIQTFGPHPTGSLVLASLRDYLYGQFSAMNLAIRLDPWQEKHQSGENIVATLQTRTCKRSSRHCLCTLRQPCNLSWCRR